MSRLERDARDAERAARRAKRLAERAEERAVRKAEQAEQAAARAAKLAARARNRHARSRDESIEAIVDEVTGQAEQWIDEKTRHLFEESVAGEEQDDGADSSTRQRRRHDHRKKHRPKRRWGQLYRDTQHKKLFGVCAGVADYFDRPTWEIRVYALLGLIFIPSLTLPTYLAMYFIMDDKPYYRRVADRFDEVPDSEPGYAEPSVREPSAKGYSEPSAKRNANNKRAKNRRSRPPPMDSIQAMKLARSKFADLEQRLRQMEAHVTSSRFELQRAFQKISAEEA